MIKNYRVNPEVLTTEVDDELGMMSIKNGSYYTLNPVGKRIWQLLEQGIAIDDMINILVKEYNVSKEICKNDIIDLMNVLEKKSLVNTI